MNKLQQAEVFEAESVEQENPGFRVTDKASADWCLRKIAAYWAEVKEARELVEAEQERLRQWLTKETQRAFDAIAFFEGHLAAYLRQVNQENPKVRSISLPHGRIRFRALPPEYKFEDDELREFLKQNFPHMVETITLEQFNKTEVKALIKERCALQDGVPILKDTGEAVPGVRVTERPPKFEVEVEGI